MVHHANSMTEFKAALNGVGDKLVVVDFFATWCGPCVRIAPFVEQLAKEHPECVFVKVDVDAAPDVSADCKISAMPTFVYYKQGKEVHRHTGATPDTLKQTIARLH
eukprot:GDKI01024750.1.p2 GENE.GDKI01024750.1~~GDKI01024750.1.p2  ORF type:complete len:106 (-),score=37.28 GDKI01024750.1:39-356(-)